MDLKATILAANDLGREALEVPEWDVTLWVRRLRADEWVKLSSAYAGETGVDSKLNARLLVTCVVDEAGNAIFGPDDVDALLGKSYLAYRRILMVALRLNGLDAAVADPKN